MKINPEVKKALEEGRAVVALESTIISHGMPYPRNVETALRVEKVIRDNGAIPATMGIIDGEPIIGMTPEMIEEFGKKKELRKSPNVISLSLLLIKAGEQQLLAEPFLWRKQQALKCL